VRVLGGPVGGGGSVYYGARTGTGRRAWGSGLQFKLGAPGGSESAGLVPAWGWGPSWEPRPAAARSLGMSTTFISDSWSGIASPASTRLR
jgi:hypothetical protein